MVAQNARAQAHGIAGGNSAVGPHLKGESVKIGEVPHTGILHRIIDFIYRGIDGIHRNHADDGLRRFIPIGGNITTAMGQGKFHVERSVGTKGGNMMVGIEDFDLRVRLDIAGCDLAYSAGFNIDCLDRFAV
ncbi:hypothetical protein SDC9_62860 [bioreactor metagenome]|uniref:Uncharacterized protein n=1 Tax=bioreactor metagenome TaxID=1076179 RepID=A0A644XK48_9ZZZZ